MSTSPEQIVRGVTKVVSLPAVVTKLGEAIQDPRTSNLDIENIVSEDSALAARVLRIANSAMYSFPSKIDTINKAVAVIGLQQLNDIVLACSVIKAFKGVSLDIIDMETFWKHSIAVGTTARLLAVQRRESNIERFFTAGLLHDIGRLILFMEMPVKSREAIELSASGNCLLYQAEKDLLGFDHGMLGAMLLKKWELPESLVMSTNYHHKPAVASKNQLEASVIHVSDIIVHTVNFGSSAEKFVPLLNKKALTAIGVGPDVLANVIEQLYIQYVDAVKFILGDDESL